MKKSKIVLICLSLVAVMSLLFGCESTNNVATTEAATEATTEAIVETTVAEATEEVEKETAKKSAQSVSGKYSALPSEQARTDSKDYSGTNGDMLIQRVTANANGGIQWRCDSLNNKIMVEDVISNFYDIESTTEVGDVSYFLRAIRPGEDIILFTLYDTKTGEIYSVVKYYINVNQKVSDNGCRMFNLNKREIFDYRPNAMAQYGFSEPEVVYHAIGNGN